MKIRKRNGRVVEFDSEKVAFAIWRAAQSVGGNDFELAQKIAAKVVTVLEVLFKNPDLPPTVEQIQDLVEKTLIEEGHAKTAKAFILYRAQRTQNRERREALFGPGTSGELGNFSVEGLAILKRRVLKCDDGLVVETPVGMLRRVARNLAKISSQFGEDVVANENDFLSMMINREFLPSLNLMKNLGDYSGKTFDSCVLTVGGNTENVFDTLKLAACLRNQSIDVKMSFKDLPADKRLDLKVMDGAAWLKLFGDGMAVVKNVEQGVKSVALVRVDHPSIMEVVALADNEGKIGGMELEILVTDVFMKALKINGHYDLIDPLGGGIVQSVSARMVGDAVISTIWKQSRPKMIFQSQLPLAESWSSGFLNISQFLEQDGTLNWDKLHWRIKNIVKFFGNLIVASKYKLDEKLKMQSLNLRKINLGVGGWNCFFNTLNFECRLDILGRIKMIVVDLQNLIDQEIEQWCESRNLKEKADVLSGLANCFEMKVNFIADPEMEMCLGTASSDLWDISNLRNDLGMAEVWLKALKNCVGDKALNIDLKINQEMTMPEVEQMIEIAHEIGLLAVSLSRVETDFGVVRQLTITERIAQPIRKTENNGAREVVPPPIFSEDVN